MIFFKDAQTRIESRINNDFYIKGPNEIKMSMAHVKIE